MHWLIVTASARNNWWFNSCKAVEAIQILFCMIKDFYKQIDYLQKRYDELQVCLNNNRDSALEKGKGILKYVDEYAQKLKLILNTRDEIIRIWLKTAVVYLVLGMPFGIPIIFYIGITMIRKHIFCFLNECLSKCTG